jgi:hypothetical protein
MAVAFEDGGTFQASSGDELAGGRFIASELMSDEQRSRQAACQQAFPPGAAPSLPRLAFWSRQLEGLEAPEGVRFTGSTLLSVPLALERLAPGAGAVIPSPLVGYRAVRIPEQLHSGAYNNSNREWVTMQVPSETWLRFQLPEAVLPFTAESATLRIRIDAPGRPVEVLALGAEGAAVVESWQGPHGTIRLGIEQGEMLRLDAKGGIVLGIRVGAESNPLGTAGEVVTRQGQEWRIDSAALDVAGKSADPP